MSYNSHSKIRKLIFNIINHLGPISRTALIEITDYRPATVGDVVKELLDEGLIIESGSFCPGRGRSRTLFAINKEHICALSISLAKDVITYTLSQFDGSVLFQRDMTPTGSRQALVRQIADETRRILAKYADRRMVGIGLYRPFHDPLDYRESDALNAKNEYFDLWIHEELEPLLRAENHLPVKIFSGVTLPAIAEHSFGAAKDAEDFIWVELSNGIGASLFCGGVPVGGFGGSAGELGHTVIDGSNGPVCYCGKPGCVEGTAAWPALQEQIGSALEKGVFSALQNRDPSKPLTVQEVRDALAAGDRVCMHYVRQAAEQIGMAVSNAVNLLNPKLIVLYGFMLELGNYFLDHLKQAIRENAFSFSGNFEIRTSTSSESIMPLGAAADIFRSFLQAEDYKWVYDLRLEGVDQIFDPAREII